MSERTKFDEALDAAMGLGSEGEVIAVAAHAQTNTRNVLNSLSSAFPVPQIEPDTEEVELTWGDTSVTVGPQLSVSVETPSGEEHYDITTPESLQALRVVLGDEILRQAL